MRENSVWTITVGVDEQSSRDAAQLASVYDGVFATAGIHPNERQPITKEKLVELARAPKVVAIGECGLDYHRIDPSDEAEKNRQRASFETHIQAALELNLPLMIHARESYDDVHKVLHRYAAEWGDKVRGDMHFFAGSVSDARKFLDLGFSLSFDGPVTFAASYDEVIRFAPLDRIMAETDAPFAAPASRRGKRNEPSCVREIVRSIADIRGENPETVRHALVRNALCLFLPKKGIAKPLVV